MATIFDQNGVPERKTSFELKVKSDGQNILQNVLYAGQEACYAHYQSPKSRESPDQCNRHQHPSAFSPSLMVRIYDSLMRPGSNSRRGSTFFFVYRRDIYCCTSSSRALRLIPSTWCVRGYFLPVNYTW